MFLITFAVSGRSVHESVEKECMTVTSKVRIYDLAKELKLDTKRLIEEVRREGVDVSVPSNSVSKELAEKIRNKYFPKKETTVKRAVKVVKRAALPTTEVAVAVEAPPEVDEPEVVAETPVEEEPAAPSVAPTPTTPAAPRQPTTARLVKKLTPATRVEAPVEEVTAAEEIVAPEPIEEDEPVSEPVVAAPPPPPVVREAL